MLDRREYGVLGVALVAAAFAGFLGGTRSGSAVPRGYSSAEPTTHPAQEAQPARSYRELRSGSTHPNAEVYSAAQLVLEGLLPSVLDPVPERTEERRQQMLEQRSERRAFDGAPPTIPHAIDDRAAPNCMVCHGRGARVGDRIAPQLSHRYLASCTQCHVPGAVVVAEAQAPLPFERSAASVAFAGNDFEPLAFGGLGTRAWPKAPPTVPHSEAMRERCESCHGVAGRIGLRTPHPDRPSCRQCHVPSDGTRQALGSTRSPRAPTPWDPPLHGQKGG